MPYTIIAQVIFGILKFLLKRAENKDKAEESFMKLVKRMDKLAMENSALREKYISMKEEMRKEEEKTNPKDG